MRVVFLVIVSLVLAGCAIPKQYTEYNGSNQAQTDYTYANVSIHKANNAAFDSTVTRSKLDLYVKQAEFYGLKAFYEGDPRAPQLLTNLYNNPSLHKLNKAYAAYFCNDRVKNYFHNHSTIALERKHRGVEYQNLWVRKEMEREVSERKYMKNVHYQDCADNYSKKARMPVLKIAKNGYRIINSAPHYLVFGAKTENIFQDLAHTNLTTPFGFTPDQAYKRVGINPTTRRTVPMNYWSTP